MTELTVSELDVRSQKLAKNAMIAWERGQLNYALRACAAVLRTAPGCLPVRRVQRRAQLERWRETSAPRRYALQIYCAIKVRFSRERDAAQRRRLAENLLAQNPASVTALTLFARAAAELGWPGTSAFAWEAIREIEPEGRGNLLELGRAWLAAGRPTETVALVDGMLQAHPADGDALALMREASVAQTMAKGKWETTGSFRDKLRAKA